MKRSIIIKCLTVLLFFTSCIVKQPAQPPEQDRQKDEKQLANEKEEAEKKMEDRLSKVEKKLDRSVGEQENGEWEEHLEEAKKEQSTSVQAEDKQARALVESARQHLENGEYDKAEQAAQDALDKNPNQSQAKDILASILQQKGELKDEGLRQQQMMKSWEATKDQLIHTAKVRFREGKEQYKKGNYKKATEKFRETVQRIKYMPVVGPDLESVKSDAKTYLKKAKSQKKKKSRVRKQKREAAIQKLSQKEEYERRKKKEKRVQRILDKARMAFEDEKYEKSMNLLDDAKKINPNIDEISKLRRIAWRMHHRKRKHELKERSMREFKTWYRKARDLLIPQDKTVKFPSEEKWKEISQREPPKIEREKKELTSAEKEVKQQLESRVIDSFVIQSEISLFSFINRLQNASGLNITLDPNIDASIKEKSVQTIQLEQPQTVAQILDTVLEFVDPQLDFRVKGEVVLVFQEGKVEEVQQQIFDIRDLVQKIQDYPGPKVIRGEGEGGVQVQSKGDSEPQQFEGRDFENMIKNFIGPESWNRPETSIRADRGLLFVRNNTEVLDRIRNLLNRIRDRTGVIVTIESRFLEVRSSWMRRVGNEFKGLNPTTVTTDGGSEADVGSHPSGFGISGSSDTPVTGGPFAFDEFDVASTEGQARTNNLLFTEQMLGDRSSSGNAVVNSTNVSFPANIATSGILHTDDLREETLDDGTTRAMGRIFKARTEHLFGRLVQRSSQVADNFFQTPGAQSPSSSEGLFELSIFNDLGAKALINALKKKGRGREVVAPRVTLFNNQRGNVTFARQQAFVSDIDPQVATESVVGEPVPDIVNDQAFILDVRPTVSQNRRFITLTLRPTVASLEQTLDASRIQTLIGVANNNPVFGRIEVPKVNVKRIRQTATIPDGGTLLLGGLRSLARNKRESKIPVLGNLPIVGFFFRDKKKIEDNFELMILVTARIRIMEELEDKQFSKSAFVEIGE